MNRDIIRLIQSVLGKLEIRLRLLCKNARFTRALWSTSWAWLWITAFFLFFNTFIYVRILTAIVLALFSEAIIMTVWASVPVLALVAGFRSVAEKRFSDAMSWFIFPASACALYLGGAPAGELIRLAVNKPAYDRVISKAMHGDCSASNAAARIDFLNCDGSIVVVFPWSVFSSAWFGVMFDSGDEIKKDIGQRSQKWLEGGSLSMLSCTVVERDLGGHYFVASGWYSPPYCGSAPK